MRTKRLITAQKMYLTEHQIQQATQVEIQQATQAEAHQVMQTEIQLVIQQAIQIQQLTAQIIILQTRALTINTTAARSANQ
jgi:hypothetical protein